MGQPQRFECLCDAHFRRRLVRAMEVAAASGANDGVGDIVIDKDAVYVTDLDLLTGKIAWTELRLADPGECQKCPEPEVLPNRRPARDRKSAASGSFAHAAWSLSLGPHVFSQGTHRGRGDD